MRTFTGVMIGALVLSVGIASGSAQAPRQPILLDTDVVSLLMKGYLEPAASGLDAYDWCLSYITVGELAKGITMANWGLRRWTELSDWLGHVVIVPSDLAAWITPVSYITLVAVTLLLTLLKGWVRLVVLVPTLYLAAFVWENVMLAKPEPTRYIVLGALLIALMIARPNGILGERRVEIV